MIKTRLGAAASAPAESSASRKKVDTSLSAVISTLLDQLDLARRPGLAEPRLKRP